MKNVTRKTNRTQFVPAQNAFVSAMTNVNNVAFTEKGAITNKSTLSSVLDWFGQGGALRQRSPQDTINLFTRAYAEDRLLAMKILFYFRDVPSAQGSTAFAGTPILSPASPDIITAATAARTFLLSAVTSEIE